MTEWSVVVLLRSWDHCVAKVARSQLFPSWELGGTETATLAQNLVQLLRAPRASGREVSSGRLRARSPSRVPIGSLTEGAQDGSRPRATCDALLGRRGAVEWAETQDIPWVGGDGVVG
eukprot:954920-Pyramimonas_sp.AAC.2